MHIFLCITAGEVAEAQEPLAALPGPNEEEALASAAGPEREQAAGMPRDATADVWLREGARAAVTKPASSEPGACAAARQQPCIARHAALAAACGPICNPWGICLPLP